MRSKYLLAPIALVLALGTGSTQAACGGEDDKRDYSEEVREAFIDSCESTSDGNTEACECAIDEIENVMTEEEFAEIDQTVREGGDVPDEVTDAIGECS